MSRLVGQTTRSSRYEGGQEEKRDKVFKGPCWQEVDLDDPHRHETWVCGYHGERFESLEEWENHLEERSHEPMEEGEMNIFERGELREIRDRARNMAATEGLNPAWARAYQRLGDAADNLEAMMARTEVPEVEVPEKEWPPSLR